MIKAQEDKAMEEHRQQPPMVAPMEQPMEDLVRVNSQTPMTQLSPDVAAAVAYVLKKNADLYRKLA